METTKVVNKTYNGVGTITIQIFDIAVLVPIQTNIVKAELTYNNDGTAKFLEATLLCKPIVINYLATLDGQEKIIFKFVDKL